MGAMSSATGPDALRRFVEDELLRAPFLIDQVIDGAVQHMRDGIPGMSPAERAVAADLLTKSLSNRQHLVDYYVRSLRLQVEGELSGRAPATGAATAPMPAKLSLELVDEEEVSVDVEISHTIEAVRSIAEYELRELQTFVSALIGDMDVARDYNPFRAETHARALWAASQALPMSKGYQLTFMRHASTPLAQVLRKTYAAASSRLEAAGVEPASHRTMVLPSGSRRSRPSSNEASFSPDLLRIRDSMPVRAEPPAAPTPPLETVLQQTEGELRQLPPDTQAAEYDRLRQSQRERLVASAANPVDQQSVELVGRLFDNMLADRGLPADIKLLLSRMQGPALRVALQDPKTLDGESHPVWLFTNQLAFLGDILPPAGASERDEVLRFMQNLLDHLVAEHAQNAALYQWALERLKKHDQQRLEQRCHAAAGEIATLQTLEDRIVATRDTSSSMGGTLDVAQLDTVPASLMDLEATPKRPPASAEAWLGALGPGDWVRMFMQGRWVHAQLLWPGLHGELYLFGDSASPTTWAVRRRALLTLHAERLLDTLLPRPLVRAAAKQVMRQMVR